MPFLKPFLRLVSQSRISLLGVALTTSAILADLLLVAGELFLYESSPYIGIVVYAFFPGLAVLGLVLIPLGAAWKARRRGARSIPDALAKLQTGNLRQAFQVVAILTLANMIIFGVVGYRSFHFMESREFCGLLCHEPMHAEYGTYQVSPHSEIDCVECHIGDGVSWLIKSKLDGTRQLAAVALGNYSKPIQTPLHNLRPARDVCEVCHESQSLHGNLIKVIQTFEPDEDNTKLYTVLNLRVGGGEDEHRKARGIHWHVSDTREIRYLATDARRENIVRVEQHNGDGTSRVWTRRGAEVEPGGHDTHERLMDCVDCHNRPTHVYLPPGQALDRALLEERLDAGVPWIRKLAEEVLTVPYETDGEAMAGIARLPELYAERYPEHWERHAADVEAAVPVLQGLHELYVHPEMEIEWNTYPSLIGHPTSATSACFRCHDGQMVDDQGVAITNDCAPCHYVLAERERNPMILRVLEDS